MKFVKALIGAYLYYLLIVSIFHFKNFGANEITYTLIIHGFLGIPIVLLGALIIELIMHATPKKLVILFTGFIYGITYSIIFSGEVDLDYYILVSSGLISCFGFFIYLYFRKGRSYR